MLTWLWYRRAPFTCDTFTCPELTAAVSEVAGIELEHAFDYEIANVNISINDQGTEVVQNGDQQKKTSDDSQPAFAWHYDSFPFVCVTMLSDCAGMVGGETAIRMPSGEVKKIRGPTMVCHILSSQYLFL